MSRYTLAADGFQQLWGVPWIETGGSVAGGILGDGSDSTYLASAASTEGAGAAGAAWVRMADRSIPANEAVYKVAWTARAQSDIAAVAVQVSPAIRTRLAPFEQVAVGSPVVFPPGNWRSLTSPAAGLGRFLSQAEVNLLGLYVRRTVLLTGGNLPVTAQAWLSEALITLYTTSLPQAPGIAALGTVTGTSRPLIQWTHTDRTEAAVSNKASSGTTRTLTTAAAHGFAVGQSFAVSIGDADYDTGAGVIASVPTSTTLTYTHTGAKTQSTTAASGTAWIGEDKAQSVAWVFVASSTQYTAPGFDPDIAWRFGDYVWRAAVVGYDQAITPDVDLPNGTYRVYVATASDPAGIRSWSPWSYQSFVVSTTPAPAPDLAPVWDAANARTILTVQGHANLLSPAASTIEDGTAAAWTANANCTKTASATFAKSGVYSARLSSTAAGTMSARSDPAPVTALKTYSATLAFRAGASARSCTLGIQWLDAAGSVLSTSTGTASNDATGSWLVRTASGTAPAGAVAARLLATVASTGGAAELHYVDEGGLFPTATFPAWTPGTGGAAYSVSIERSIDGSDWAPLRVPRDATLADAGGVATDQDQLVVWSDYEAPRGALVDYRARVVATSGGYSLGSDPAQESALTTLDGLVWVKAVNQPDLNHGFRTLTAEGYGESHDTLAEVFRPGGDTFVINHPGGGWDRTLRIITDSTAEKEAWVALTTTADTVLVQLSDTDSAGAGRQAYGSFTASPALAPIAPGMWEATATLVETAP